MFLLQLIVELAIKIVPGSQQKALTMQVSQAVVLAAIMDLLQKEK